MTDDVTQADKIARGPDMVAFGAKMKRYRKQARLSLDDVAKAAGMTKSHIWELEVGRSRNPTIRAVWAIAAALGTSPADMLGIDPNASQADPLAVSLAATVRQYLQEQSQ